MSTTNDTTEISVSELQQLDTATLSKLIKELQQSKADLEARRFIETSLAKFADLMRWQATDHLDSWVERLLLEMVPTMGALQACMYMTSKSATGPVVLSDDIQGYDDNSNSEDNRELILVGAYAHDEESTLTTINFGKGLIGQAAKSKRATHFNQNAKIETRTYTGLALLHPQSLVIQPLIYNETVEGVLEISSGEDFSRQQMDFLRLLSEAIAANLMTIRSQEEMRRLYIAMQTKTESLTAQEEEMRQNMEEMAATQEEMARLRTQAEQQAALQSSTIDSFQDGIIAVDPNLEIMLFNAAAKSLMGLQGFELEKGKNIEAYFNEGSYSIQKVNWSKALNGDSFSSEERLIAPDGKTEYIFLYHFSPIFNLKRSGMLGACALLRNVTEERRKQIEIEDLKQKAEKQSNFLQSLLDGMQNGVIAIDRHLNIRLFNQLSAKTCEKFGLNIQVANPFIDLVHQEHREQFLQYSRESLSGKLVEISIFYQFTEIDRGAWYDISFIPISENDGSISGVIVEFENVNEKKLQSIEVEELKNNAVAQSTMLQSMMNGMQSGIIMIDLNYEVKLVNTLATKFTQQLGFSFEVGDSYMEKLGDEGRMVIEGFIYKAASGESTEITIPYVLNDDEGQYWVNIAFIPVLDNKDKISAIIIEFKDVTEKTNQQLKIEALNQTSTAERNLRQLVIDNMDTELMAIDREYRLTILNESAIRLFKNFGIFLEEGAYLEDGMDPAYRDIIMEDWRRAMNGEPVRKLNRYRFPDEDYEHVFEVNYTPAYNAAKTEIEGVVVLFRDVTATAIQTAEIEQLREEAIIQKKYLESIFNEYNNPILAIDRDYSLTYFNENTKQFFATLQTELIIGVKIEKIFKIHFKHVADKFKKSLENGDTFTDIEILNKSKGHDLILETTYGPVLNEEKGIIGAWMCMRDITDLKNREQALVNKIEEIKKIEERLMAELSKKEQLIASTHSLKDEEQKRHQIEKNYAKFKAQIDNLSEQLTRKDAEIKKLKTELESQI